MNFNQFAMRIIFSLSLIFISLSSPAQEIDTSHYFLKNLTYKNTPEADLTMDIYYPEDYDNEKLPAVVFFFGGGWVGGNRQHFAPQSKYLASRGIIAITPDYRIKNEYGTTPQQAVMDARSAMRYIKQHADELGVDTSKLAAGGGSAGGHLALSTATLTDFNDPNDDLSVSPMPKALLLFNPVVNTTSEGFGVNAVSKDSLNLSPYHRMLPEMPETLIFHGEEDTTVPIENINLMATKMDALLISYQIYRYKAVGHGFFNINREGAKYFYETLYRSDLFLQSLGYLEGPATLKPYP